MDRVEAALASFAARARDANLTSASVCMLAERVEAALEVVLNQVRSAERESAAPRLDDGIATLHQAVATRLLARFETATGVWRAIHRALRNGSLSSQPHSTGEDRVTVAALHGLLVHDGFPCAPVLLLRSIQHSLNKSDPIATPDEESSDLQMSLTLGQLAVYLSSASDRSQVLATAADRRESSAAPPPLPPRIPAAVTVDIPRTLGPRGDDASDDNALVDRVRVALASVSPSELRRLVRQEQLFATRSPVAMSPGATALVDRDGLLSVSPHGLYRVIRAAGAIASIRECAAFVRHVGSLGRVSCNDIARYLRAQQQQRLHPSHGFVTTDTGSPPQLPVTAVAPFSPRHRALAIAREGTAAVVAEALATAAAAAAAAAAQADAEILEAAAEAEAAPEHGVGEPTEHHVELSESHDGRHNETQTGAGAPPAAAAAPPVPPVAVRSSPPRRVTATSMVSIATGPEALSSSARTALRRIADAVAAETRGARHVFAACDRENAGGVRAPDFAARMKRFGALVSVDDADELVRCFNRKADGRLDLSEFVRMLAFAGSVVP